MIRLILRQYRLSRRIGFGRRKAIKRAVSIYLFGFN